MPEELDQAVRSAAFQFLAEHTRLHGETFERAVLEQGFVFRGQQVRLVGPQGILKPTFLDDRAPEKSSEEPASRIHSGSRQAIALTLYRFNDSFVARRETDGRRSSLRISDPSLFRVITTLPPGPSVPLPPVALRRFLVLSAFR